MSEAKIYFVTGTDTDAGKTLISASLLYKAQSQGLSTAALKPVAAGCRLVNGGWVNEDVEALFEQCSVPLTYDEMNPVALRSPIAPHIAAQQENVDLSVASLVQSCKTVTDKNADFTIVEGAGGWLVPLNDSETLADYACEAAYPVILVVGMRLGCLNHALLTVAVIEQAGLTLAGWVATQLDQNMPVANENFESLKHRIAAPCLGRVPFMHEITPLKVGEFLDISELI